MASQEKFDPQDMESDIRVHWESVDAPEKVKETRLGKEKHYVPRTPVKVDEVLTWNNVFKNVLYDAWSKFQSMNDMQVRDNIGFDPFGLSLRKKIIKKHQVENLEEITPQEWREIYSELDEHTEEFRQRFEKEYKNLGIWLESEDIYSTKNGDFLDSIWWTINKLYQDDLMEKKKEPLLWCPQCKSTIPDNQIEFSTDSVEHSIIKVPVKSGKNRYFLADVSAPWTLPGALAMAVNPNKNYAVIKYKEGGVITQFVVIKDNLKTILAKAGIEEYELTNIIPGDRLKGMEYKYPLRKKVPYQEDLKGEWIHKIITSEKVSTEATGVRPLAPAYFKKDWEIAKEYGIDPYNPVKDNGHYNSGVEENKYSGFPTVNSNPVILNDLQSEDLLFARWKETEKEKNCPYCSSKLLRLPKEEWFFEIDQIMENVESREEELPELIGYSEGQDWISKLGDWILTRGGDFGIPFPYWRCECGADFVPEDRFELSENSDIDEDSFPNPQDLKEAEVRCPECNEIMEWDSKVLNFLAITAASPWAQLGYPSKEEDYDIWWPGKVLFGRKVEKTDAFTANLSFSMPLFDEPSVEKMISQGDVIVDDENRDFLQVEKDGGYDSIRLKLLSDKSPWEDRTLDFDELEEPYPLERVTWNVYNFTKEQFEDRDISLGKLDIDDMGEEIQPEDDWILSRVENSKEDIKDAYEEARYNEAISLIEDLVMDDLAQWYVGLIRNRISEGEENEILAGLAALQDSLLAISKIIVPLAPHLAEDIYQQLDGLEKSVQMTRWPETDVSLVMPDLNQEMQTVQNIVDDILKYKSDMDLPQKWPLKKVVLDCQDPDMESMLYKFQHIVEEKAFIQDLEIVDEEEEWDEMDLKVQPNRDAIGQTYQQWVSRIATMLKHRPSDEIKEGVESGEYTMGIEGRIIEITPEMLTFETVIPDGYEALEGEEANIYLDFEITDEIWNEQIAHELSLRLESMASEFDLEDSDEIEIYIDGSRDILDAVNEHRSEILEDVNGREIHLTGDDMGKAEYVLEWDISGEVVYLGVTPLYRTQVIDAYEAISGMNRKKAKALYDSGYTSFEKLEKANASELSKIEGIKRSLARRIVQTIKEEKEELKAKEKKGEEEEVKEQKEAEKAETEEKVEEAEPVEVEEEMEKKELPKGITRSSTYLLASKDQDQSFQLFKNILETGMNGLCVTRDYPDKVKDKYGLDGISIIWLSNVDQKNVIRPKNLEKFSLALEDFLSKKGGVILITGLDYLITNNEFRTVLHLLQSIKDQVAINDSILLMHLNPTTMEEHQLELIEGEVDRRIKPA